MDSRIDKAGRGSAVLSRGNAGIASEDSFFEHRDNIDSLGFLLHDAHQKMSRLLQVYVQRYGITAAQWYFIPTLYVQDGIPQVELSNRVGLTTATTVIALRTLEKKGLVVRQRHPTDARVSNVYLTRKARQMEERLKQRGSAINVAASRDLDSAKLREIKAALRTICRNFAAELKQTMSTNGAKPEPPIRVRVR
jgi:DNA-binding MarR family transcriptional regulator